MLNCKERREEIVNIIEENKRISIDELVSNFNVTEQAIYRDLNYLERKNKIERTSKGAIASQSNATRRSLNLDYRETIYFKEKEAIGRFASTLIQSGDSLIIDGGSTTLVFATSLVEKRRLIVLTNINTIGTIIKKEKLNRAILIGGYLLKSTHTTVSKLAKSIILQHRVNKTIIGVCAIDVETGCFYTNIEEEAKIKQAMIEVGRELIILADSSKVKKEKKHFVCDYTLDKHITLITDDKLSKSHKKALEAKNIKVITV